jgi:uncharacterized protein YggE
MKSRALAALAALSILSAPVAVQAAKPVEVILQIEATAQVAPDRAVVPLTISGTGETEAAARADLRKNEDLLVAALAEKGIDAARIKADGPDNGKDPVKILDDDESACAAADAAAAAADAAAPSPRKGKAAVKVTDYPSCGATLKTASKTLLVSVDDPSKVDQLQTIGSGEGYPGARLRPVFSQSDPDAARKKARTEALAKANVEAEAYAEALGYRVVRIVRVSNAKPSINLPDMFSFIGNMEDRSARMQPSWFAATVSESVRIEYVIAPK